VPWAVSKDLGRAKAPTVQCIENLDPSGSGPQPPGTHAATPSAERAPRALDAMHGNISGSVTFAALTFKISLISAYPCPMHATQDPLAEPLSSSTAANPLLSGRTRRATLYTHASAALIRPRSETHLRRGGRETAGQAPTPLHEVRVGPAVVAGASRDRRIRIRRTHWSGSLPYAAARAVPYSTFARTSRGPERSGPDVRCPPACHPTLGSTSK